MKSLRLINYRCFEDTKEVILKPITLLLGANSTGKSSFLKFFPLLKQSSGVNVRGFFLWNGDLVDFKDFKNTVKDGKGDLTFEFKIDKLKWLSTMGKINSSITNDVSVKITLANVQKTPYDYLKELVISFDSDPSFPTNKIQIEFSNSNMRSLTINDDKVSTGKTILSNIDTFLPNIFFITETPNHGINYTVDVSKDIANVCNCTEEQVLYIAKETPRLIGAKDFLKELRQVTNSNIEITIEQQKKLQYLLIYSCLNDLITSILFFLKNTADNVYYILPLRAVTERNYSFRNSSVETIEPDGKNLPMFLNSLKDAQKKDLNEWLKRNFSIELDVINNAGRVELDIIEYKSQKGSYLDASTNYSNPANKKKTTKRNLVDVGFGYTQILPIIITIWNIIRKDREATVLSRILKYNERIIVIEQPELHLHPRFQKAFADMLAKIVSDEDIHKRLNIKFIIETHSEAIVNRLGEDIGQGRLDKNKVSLVFFNEEIEGAENERVTSIEYDDGGYIEKWPIGFFSEYDN